MKKILVTGITGQDGYYLSQLLLNKGYEVHGTVRRSSSINTERIDGFLSEYKSTGQFNLHYSDLLDSSSLNNLISNLEPEKIFNLAAQSHVAVSFQIPEFTIKVGTIGTLNILEAIKNINKDIKFYQASSSEMYGGKSEDKLNEDSKFDPKSPYAAAKVFSHDLTKIYRESYGMFCSNGILFNHESPFRGETFVTRKITRAVGRIHMGLQSKLTLGNLNAKRDWGFAGDYVDGMYKILDYSDPSDWVIATGTAHSVEDFAKKAINYCNDELWGNLGVSVIIKDHDKKFNEHITNLYIDKLNYGTVAVNEWAAIGYIIPQLPWGGFPGNRDNDIQSGQSVVHNSMLFESPLKGVVNTKFRISRLIDPPWFVTNNKARRLFRNLTYYQINNSNINFLKLIFAALV